MKTLKANKNDTILVISTATNDYISFGKLDADNNILEKGTSFSNGVEEVIITDNQLILLLLAQEFSVDDDDVILDNNNTVYCRLTE